MCKDIQGYRQTCDDKIQNINGKKFEVILKRVTDSPAEH